MQLWSVLGQYLLLSFVLPGFCYLAAFYLCFPGALGRVFPGVLGQIGPGVPLKKDGSPSTQGKTDNNEEDDNSEDDEEDDNEEGGKKKGAKKEASQGFWVTLLAVIFGLLLSSVTFFLEIMLRKSRDFDCKWFTRIPFDKLAAPAPDNPLANFLAAETIMHFNIAVGFLIIFAIWIGIRGKS